MWRRCIAYANDPERLFARFHHQVDATYVNRMVPPAKGKLTWANLSGALVLAFRVFWHIGVQSDYRRPFWRAARHALRRGQIDAVFGMGFIAHHLIEFTREALRGEQNASYYSAKARSDRAREPQPWARTGLPERRTAQVGVMLVARLRLARRLHGPKLTPFGRASCSIIISPTVSDVTRPTSRPVASTTATAGADFSCSMRNASSRQRRWLTVGSVRRHRVGDAGVGAELLERADEVAAAEQPDRLAGAVDHREFALAGAQQRLAPLRRQARPASSVANCVIIAVLTGTPRDIARIATACASEAAAR